MSNLIFAAGKGFGYIFTSIGPRLGAVNGSGIEAENRQKKGGFLNA